MSVNQSKHIYTIYCHRIRGTLSYLLNTFVHKSYNYITGVWQHVVH